MSVAVQHGGPAGRQLLITQRLRQRRADLGLTQQQVVTRLARCGVQTTNRALSSLEHGAGVDVAKLPELAAALDCTVTYLVGLTDDPRAWQPDHPSVDVAQPHRSTPAAPRQQAAHLPVAAVGSMPAASLILGPAIPDRGQHPDLDSGTGGR